MTVPSFLPQSALGLIKLDTQFPRLPGDLGLASSWGPRVCEFVVQGAFPSIIVKQQQSFATSQFAGKLTQAVKALTQSGVSAMTTSCGFLVIWQKALQALTQVPIVTSSLCLLPELLQKEEQVGVLSIDEKSLTPMHWLGAGLNPQEQSRLVIAGVSSESHFCQAILGNQTQLNEALAREEVVAAAFKLKKSAPRIKTLILECTNLPPYQLAIENATGLKVLSLRDVPQLLRAAGTLIETV